MLGRRMTGRSDSVILISLVIFSFANCWTQIASVDGKEADEMPIETIVVDELNRLPEPFKLSKLPQTTLESSNDEEKVEFDHLGMIDKLLGRQPDDPYSTDTQFHLFKGGQRKTVPFRLFRHCLPAKVAYQRDNCQTYPVNLSDILNIFDMDKRTLIIIGGFLMNAPADWQLQIADKWLRLEDVNVVIVSWNKGNKFRYLKAVSNTKLVARQVVILLYYLSKLHNRDPRDRKFTENIMIVGHSLGAHIAGFIGQDFGGKIGRITGLDPAGPAFTTSKESHRLDRNDALLVDVIHTNADFGFKFFLGLYTPIGHVDYYANDGKWQPNCKMSNFFECNHSAVINYYIAILDHELIIRDYFDRQLREKYRMIAYRSNTYTQFRNGQSMHTHCPNMSNDGDDTYNQGGAVDFNRCTVPIDFIKKAREFRQELIDNFKINFEPDYVAVSKFWFFTSAKHPYVVDHNLIKMHYNIPAGIDVNKNECDTKITYTMLDGESNESNIPRLKPTVGTLDRYNDHPQSTIPFVVTNRLGRYMLIDIDAENFYVEDKIPLQIEEFQRKVMKHVYKIFPLKIDIESKRYIEPRERVKDNSISRWLVAKKGDRNMMRFKSALDQRLCPYTYKTIRIQPLRTTNRFFMAVYTDSFGDPKLGFKPEIIVLKKGQKIPRLNMKTSDKGKNKSRFYLNAIIIGPNHYKVPNREGPTIASRTPYIQFLDENPFEVPLDKLDIEAEFLSKKVLKRKDSMKQIEARVEPMKEPTSNKLVYFDLTNNELVETEEDQHLVEEAKTEMRKLSATDYHEYMAKHGYEEEVD